MTLLEQTLAAVLPVDRDAGRQAQARLDQKTKPRGSLGRLEELACRLAAVYRTADPVLPAKAVVVMAADHGVAEEGVSAYPQDVTAQMVKNFLTGGAAINVLARQQGARVVVADLGTKCPVELPQVRDHRLGPGTANFTRGPAMSRATAVRALEAGIRLADELAGAGIRLADELAGAGIGLLGVGDMGIGNTTAASAVTAVLCGADAADVTGRGTGIDDDRLRLKVRAVERALEVNRPDPADALDVLAKVGGFEIAGLAGVVLGAAARRVPVILDGFITGAAGLAAVRLCPEVRHYLVASHRSVEPGHAAVLRQLGQQPLFDLGMRLGEGTGAVLAMNLAEAALRILREMATFEAAGVTDAGGVMDPATASALLIPGAALLLDLCAGEYPSVLHPVVWVGWLISGLLRLAPAAGWWRQFLFGALLTVVVVALCAGSAVLVMKLAAIAPPFVGLVPGVLLLKASFALRELGGAAERVRRPVEAGDLPAARAALRSLCSRDPAALDGEGLLAAAIQSLAENASDSFVAPLFYYLLFGVPGAVAYRAINTLDAMIGYRGRYEALGKVAARLDDVANLIPARLTAGLLLLAGALLRKDVRGGWRVLRRDGARTPSPNGGRPMAVMAGLLRVRLEKKGAYALGDPATPLTPAAVRDAWRLVAVAGWLAAALCALGILALHR